MCFGPQLISSYELHVERDWWKIWAGNEWFVSVRVRGFVLSVLVRSGRSPAGLMCFSLLVIERLLRLGCSPTEPSLDEELKTVDWQGLTGYPFKCAEGSDHIPTLSSLLSLEEQVGVLETMTIAGFLSHEVAGSGSGGQWERRAAHQGPAWGKAPVCYINWRHSQSIV